jgi:hypothetical protein
MGPETLDVPGFIRGLLDRGWRWSEADPDLLVHPGDHALCIRHDPAADRLYLSPELDAHIRLVIPTSPSKGRFWR